ncbi:MAG TPA: RNA methyltransferase [Longimicrobiales bacterium]
MSGDAPSRSEIRLIRGLRRRKEREARGLFLAEGIRVVEELVAAGLGLRLAVVAPSARETERGGAVVAALEARCPVRQVSERELIALADTETPQGVVVVAEAPRAALADVRLAGRRSMALVLDGVQDPGNVGTLTRTAEALGAAFVAVLPGTADPWGPKAVRAAAGSAFRIPIVLVEPEALIEWLHAKGFMVYVADASGAPAEAVGPAERAALVVGNEGAGVRPPMRAVADRVVSVPIRGGAESLNVAVAAGILLYLLTRRS